MGAISLWQIRLTTDTSAAPHYAQALEQFCPTVSWMDTDEDGVVEVEALSEERLDRKAVMAALRAVRTPVPDVHLDLLPQKNWLALSFQGFPPRRLGRFWIYGSHDAHRRPPPGSWPLLIDAATAFGSGEHPTTAGCLYALERLARRKRPGRSLDMGTGSGILAIAAIRAGSRHVTGIDIDPESVRVARRHARANRITRHLQLQSGPGYRAPLARRQGPYDLILCNILARPLRQMAPAACRALKRGGHIVLAGLLDKQAAGVISAYRAQGLALLRREQRGEWTILEFYRRKK